MLLKIAWWRGPGAVEARAEVDSLAVPSHITSLSKALATIRALVRARHLVDGLDVLGEAVLDTEGFAAGRTLEVLDLGVYSPHVAHHILGLEKHLEANTTFIALLSGRLPVAVRETEASLVLHKNFAVVEDVLTTFADQLTVVLSKLEAVFLGACVLVDEERALCAIMRSAAFALPAFFAMIFLALKTIPRLDIDAKLLGVLLAVVD